VAGSPQLLTRWRGWPKGDAGLVAAQLMDPQSFEGQNLVVGQSGAVQPRGGLHPLDPVMIDVTKKVWFVDVARGPGGNLDDFVWFIQEQILVPHSTVRRFKLRDASTGAFVTQQTVVGYGGDFIDSVALDRFGTCQEGDNITWLVVPNAGLYRIHHTNQTVEDISTAPNDGSAIAIFGERMLVGDCFGGRRVRFSGAADFTSWPSTNFFDVGRAGESIRGLYVVGQTCYVLMKEGTIYAITGTVGVNETVRQVNVYGEHTAGVAYQRAAVATRNNVLWHCIASGFERPVATTYIDQVPVATASGRQIEHPELDGFLRAALSDSYASPVYVLRLDGLDDVAFAYGERVWAFVNGAWSRHTFPVLNSTNPIWAHAYFGYLIVFDTNYTPSRFFLCNISPESLEQAFGADYYPYDRNTTVSTPTVTFINEELLTSQWEDPNGKIIEVRAVDVEFTRGPVGTGLTQWDNTEFVVELDYVGIEGSGANTRSAPLTYSAALPATSERVMKRFVFEAARCRAVRVRLSGVKACRIEELRLYGAVEQLASL
jgi:hypothetical protein